MHRGRLTAVGLAALAFGCGIGAEAPPLVAHTELDRVLEAVVRGEGVDYAALRERHLDRLRRYLDSLASADLGALPQEERLAALINLYNATVLDAVTRRYRPGYSVEEGSFALFREPLVRLAGERISLDQLEHDRVRRFREPRVHVALVCAARSCPPLLPRAYRGADLDRTLEDNMRRFLRDPSRNAVEVATRRLRLSRLFDWYAEDFGGPAGVVPYVDRYLEVDVSGFAVEFAPYSWELNDVSRR